MAISRREHGLDLGLTLLLASVVSLLLYAYAVFQAGQVVLKYLPWNLCLAWLPLLLAVILTRYLKRHAWSSWPALLITLLWLIFLPNSFYIVTDLIHLPEVYMLNLVTAAAVFTSFVFSGLLLGFTSLHMVHLELHKRLGDNRSAGLVAAVLAICSLAIYIGRDLRWNSWDLMTNPAGLLFDISDRVMHPSEYGQIMTVGLSFFVLLAGMYFVVWRLLMQLRRARR